MQAKDAGVPEVVVEEQGPSGNVWRIATLGVLGLTLLVCICYSAIFLLNPFQLGSSPSGVENATPTRRSQFAATWTPTPTESPTPTITPRATSTSTHTPTATAVPTNTPVPPPAPTNTNTPRPPTNTPRPRPTNTPRPPTNTPVPPPAPTNTNTPAPSYAFSITSQRSFQNAGSNGVFGTVRDRNNNLVGEMKVLVIASAGNAFVATSAPSFINNSTDRNYEVSNANGLGPGSYTVYLAVKVGSDYNQVSPAVTVNITPIDSGVTQWWGIDFKQN